MLNKHLLLEKTVSTWYKIVLILQHFLLNQSYTNIPAAAFGSCPVSVSLWSRWARWEEAVEEWGEWEG